MDSNLLIVGIALWTIGFGILKKYSKEAKEYLKRSSELAYKKVGKIYRERGKKSKDILLAELDNVLAEWSSAKDDANAPRNLFISFLVWGGFSIISGLMSGVLPNWILAIIAIAAICVAPFFAFAVVELLNMVKE
jgi:hypothetical protein